MTESDFSNRTSPEFAVRRGAARWVRRLFLFGVVSTASVLLCCVATVVVRAVFGPTHTVVAAEVTQIAHRIVPIRIPPGFEGAEGLSGDSSVFWLQIARFDQQEGRGLIVIGEMRIRPLPKKDEYDHPQLVKLLDELAPNLRLLDVKQSREESVTIRGEKVTFKIEEGEDRASTTRLRQVTGSFPGHEGRASLIVQAEEGYLSDQTVEDVLQSLADKPQAK